MYTENGTDIISLLEPRFLSGSVKGRSIPPSLQVLKPLSFACGTIHCKIGALCSISKPTVCIRVQKTCNAICERKNNYIKFLSAATKTRHQVKFCENGNFPKIIGCTDHIPMKCPYTADAEEYGNEKTGFH
ncbi:putative nuclease HARBI1 [Arapaima gigas]